MRTVHTYSSGQQQQQQQEQQQQQQQSMPSMSSSASASSSATNQTTTTHQHAATSNNYSSVRHSLIRMHSQLRSAPNGRESTQAPIDLSLSRISRPTPKVATRSTTATVVTPRSMTSFIAPPTHCTYNHPVYTNASTCTSSKSAKSTNTYEQDFKVVNTLFTGVTQKCADSQQSRSISVPSPKLAYECSNIEENLQCPLCIDRLRDPRALPCQHVFCCSCLKSIPSSNLAYPTISCPLCRRTFPYNGADQFPISYIHRQLLELVPKSYDVNGKCTKCQEKARLTLCSCCDFLLCQKCFANDREKIIDNIQHMVQTCYCRLQHIHSIRDQLKLLNDINRKKIHQIETIFSNFERGFFEHKQRILSELHKYNQQIIDSFWSKLHIPTCTTTEPFYDLLKRAELLIEKTQPAHFEDILSLFYNLSSVSEQLEQAHSLVDTCDVQNLLKQTIQIHNNNNNNNQLDEHTCVQLNQFDNTEKAIPLLPSSILSRSTKRSRKTEPKRLVEQNDDDDDDDDHKDDDLPILKQMKVEYPNDVNLNNSSPSSLSENAVFCLNITNNEHQQSEINEDNDVIYLETIQTKSPGSIVFDDFFQFMGTEE